MDYVTADGITLRTGYSNKKDWYLVYIRELLDNSADFKWKYYPGSTPRFPVRPANLIVTIKRNTEPPNRVRYIAWNNGRI
jgi:hypothetical protein